ncbi:MAG: glycosyltransferase [Thermodesulfovibrionales bacterium]
MLSGYSGISPKSDLTLLKRLADKLRGRTFLHVNSTRAGGGVAEILQRMLPILENIGINVRWEVLEGDERFFDITKKIHNALQGNAETITREMWDYHFDVNKRNAGRLNLEADAVLIHDPQPAPLIEYRKAGTWMWRCHIDLSSPAREVFDFIRRYCERYDAAIFSVARFAKSMPIDEFIITPSIDPLSDKNRDLTESEIRETVERLNIPLDKPVILQVSRFDRFKDPLGVLQAFLSIKKYNDCILVLAGSPATDDPEGEAVLKEVREQAADDPDIYILLLPPYSDRDINALQRIAAVVFQKSVREGFGLTVSEAMWKGKAVVAGAAGGIPVQITHGVNGFLVNSVEGAAFRARQLLNNPEMVKKMGENAREYVRKNFLITRQTRDYLSAWYSIENKGTSVLEL